MIQKRLGLLMAVGIALATAVTMTLPGAAGASGASNTRTDDAALIAAAGIGDYLMTAEQSAATDQGVIIHNQDMISQLSDALVPDEPAPTGFAGTVSNPATGSLDVWWKGEIPTKLQVQIDQFPELRVTVHRATFSQFELTRAIESHRSALQGVDLAFPREDGSAIVLTHAPDTQIDSASLGDLLGYPVIAAVDQPAVNTTGGRQADVPDRTGGAMMITRFSSTSVGYCSTGFAVLKGAYGYLLSAAHCDWDSGGFAHHDLYNGASALMAHAADTLAAPDVDSMLINATGGTQGMVYVGGPWSTTKKKVAGTVTNNVGDSVSTSGANSGRHTGLNIVNDAYPGTCPTHACTLIVASNPGGVDASVIGGDSGGPVFTTRSDDRVNARGIIVQGAQPVTCPPYVYFPGWYDSTHPKCFNNVRYVPIRPLLSTTWGATIETMS